MARANSAVSRGNRVAIRRKASAAHRGGHVATRRTKFAVPRALLVVRHVRRCEQRSAELRKLPQCLQPGSNLRQRPVRLPHSGRPRQLPSRRKNQQFELLLCEQLPADHGSDCFFDSLGEPIVSSNGFTVQLNANSQQGVDSAQQYVFLIQGNSIKGQISNWQTLRSQSCVTPSTLPRLRSTTVYQRGIRCKLLFNTKETVLAERCSKCFPPACLWELPRNFLVSQAGCNCSDLQQQCPPSQPGQFCCSGYQSSADLSPITAFQVNIVGPGGGAPTTLSGAGDIQYSVSSGALTPLSSDRHCALNSLFARTRPRTPRTDSSLVVRNNPSHRASAHR